MTFENYLYRLTGEVSTAVKTKDTSAITMKGYVLEFLKCAHVIARNQNDFNIRDLRRLEQVIKHIGIQYEKDMRHFS